MGRLKILILTSILFILLAGIGGYYYYENYIKVIPEELIQKALDETLKVESYRYHVKIELNVDNTPVIISDLEGEKANDKDFHIFGTMQDQQVEVFQIANITYMKDSLTNKWVIIPENPVFETEYFMAEINPLASFVFTNLNDLQYLGREKIGGQKYYVMHCLPEVNNEFLNRYWQDFEYKLWIDSNKRIVRAEVKAVNKAKPSDTLTMVVDLKDFHAKIKLEPPV